MSENGHILPTHSAIKLAKLVCSISGPGDEELSQLADSVSLLHFEGASGAHPSPRLFDISVLSSGRHTLLLRYRWHLIEPAQHLISGSDNNITHGEIKELRSHTEQFLSTNWSLMDPGADSSPPPPQSDRETPADVLWPESRKMKDLRSTDLKQENMSYKHGANEE